MGSQNTVALRPNNKGAQTCIHTNTRMQMYICKSMCENIDLALGAQAWRVGREARAD